MEDARWLRTYVGKTGFVQLGFPQQGVMMVYEASTPWYERYQNILEMADDFAGLSIDEPDQDDDKPLLDYVGTGLHPSVKLGAFVAPASWPRCAGERRRQPRPLR